VGSWFARYELMLCLLLVGLRLPIVGAAGRVGRRGRISSFSHFPGIAWLESGVGWGAEPTWMPANDLSFDFQGIDGLSVVVEDFEGESGAVDMNGSEVECMEAVCFFSFLPQPPVEEFQRKLPMSVHGGR